jgi:hypothetical protein
LAILRLLVPYFLNAVDAVGLFIFILQEFIFCYYFIHQLLLGTTFIKNLVYFRSVNCVSLTITYGDCNFPVPGCFNLWQAECLYFHCIYDARSISMHFGTGRLESRSCTSNSVHLDVSSKSWDPLGTLFQLLDTKLLLKNCRVLRIQILPLWGYLCRSCIDTSICGESNSCFSMDPSAVPMYIESSFCVWVSCCHSLLPL